MNAEQYSINRYQQISTDINRYQQIYTTCCFKLCRSALPRWSQWQQASHGSPHFWYSEASLVTTWNSGNTATRTAKFGHILNRHARSYFRKMVHIAPLHKNAQTDGKVLAAAYIAYCSSVQDCVATLPIWLAANLVHLHCDLKWFKCYSASIEKIWKAKTWTILDSKGTKSSSSVDMMGRAAPMSCTSSIQQRLRPGCASFADSNWFLMSSK